MKVFFLYRVACLVLTLSGAVLTLFAASTTELKEEDLSLK
jgi:hypothetical protein